MHEQEDKEEDERKPAAIGASAKQSSSNSTAGASAKQSSSESRTAGGSEGGNNNQGSGSSHLHDAINSFSCTEEERLKGGSGNDTNTNVAKQEMESDHCESSQYEDACEDGGE